MQIRRRRVTLLDVSQGNVSPKHSLRADKSIRDILRVICLLIIVYGLTSVLLLSKLTHMEHMDSNELSLGLPFINTGSSIELSELSFPSSSSSKPRVFGYYFDARSVSTRRPPARLPVHWDNAIYELYPSKRQVLWEEEDEKGQQELANSEEYSHSNSHNRDVSPYDSTPECQPMHEWQTKSFPTCNTIHEKDLTYVTDPENEEQEQLRMIAHGYFRDVYIVGDRDGDAPVVLKTTRFRRDFDRRLFDKHRMDAVASDRMSPSSHVLPIYGFCGVAGFFAFAEGGDLLDRIYDEEESGDDQEDDFESKYLRRLHYAMDVANAIADLHTIDSRDRRYSAIVHADIYPTQFVEHEGRFKLNDFNRCQFMYWNTTSNAESCPYIYDDYNAGTFRSPEEYFYSAQTEKIDVYSMGNIFYFLLLGSMPFEDVKEEESHYVKELVMNGTRPALRSEILNSKSPCVQALINAMKMCHIFHWRERTRASEIRDYLQNELDAIEAR